MKCSCGVEIHSKRSELGYKKCLECSTEKKWGVIPITYHKTGNTIEIVKDPDLANTINAMSKRTGFGVMKGLTSSYKHTINKESPAPKQLPEKILIDREISRTKLESDWYIVGEESVEIAENSGIDTALAYINIAFDQKRIFKCDVERLTQILNILISK